MVDRFLNLCSRDDSYVFHLLGEGVQSLVLRLRVGDQVASLAQVVLQLQDPLLIIGLLAGRLLDQRLFPALAIRCYLPVVGVRLPKGLEKTGNQQNNAVSPRMVEKNSFGLFRFIDSQLKKQMCRTM